MSILPAAAGRHSAVSRVDRGWPMLAKICMWLGAPTLFLGIVWFTLVVPVGKWAGRVAETAINQFLSDQHTLMEKLGDAATRNALSQETTARALDTISHNQSREARALEQIKSALQNLASIRSDRDGAQTEPIDHTGEPLQ